MKWAKLRATIHTAWTKLNSGHPGSMDGRMPVCVEVIAVAKEPAVVMIRAKVESASPERIQYKPYSTTLTFDDNLFIEIPIPAEHVIATAKGEKGGQVVLSLEGWTIFLDVYASVVEKMNEKWTLSKQNPTKNYRPY